MKKFPSQHFKSFMARFRDFISKYPMKKQQTWRRTPGGDWQRKGSCSCWPTFRRGIAVYLNYRHLLLIYCIPQTSKKDRLSTSPYLLSRLQEIFVSAAIAKMMSPHTVPRENHNKNIHRYNYLLSVNIGILGSNLLSGFLIYFLPKLASWFFKVCTSLFVYRAFCCRSCQNILAENS